MNIRTALPDDLPGILKYDRHIRRDRLMDCIVRGAAYVLTDGKEIVGILPPEQDAAELMFAKELSI